MLKTLFGARLTASDKKKSGRLSSKLVMALALMMATSLFSGCDENFVYQRAISELNAKAQEHLNQGDARGAVGRLEAALDLNPGETATLYNLAIAYDADGQWDKSIETFKQLLDKAKNQPGKLSGTGPSATGKDSADGLPSRDKLLKSLGVVYEKKADMIISKAVEGEQSCTEKPWPKAKLDGAAQEALEVYRAAQTAYEESVKLSSGNTNELSAHLTGLQDAMKKLEEEGIRVE